MLDLLRLQLTTFIMNDVPTPYACYFQDSATPNQEGILELHDNIMFYLLVILGLVSWMLYTIVITYSKNPIAYKYIKHWTYRMEQNIDYNHREVNTQE